jgi:hypothetical protein
MNSLLLVETVSACVSQHYFVAFHIYLFLQVGVVTCMMVV